MSHRTEIEQIFESVQSWPSEDRVALAYEILRDLRRRPLIDPPRHTIQRALGLLRGQEAPPTDEQVKQWIDEHRMSKYGQ